MRSSWVMPTLLTLAVLGAGSVHASPPPPPPPDVSEGSCGSVHTAAPFLPAGMQVAPLGPESIGVKDGRLGKLTFAWGLRLTSSSPRLKAVTGLEISGATGFLAVTGGGDWMRFDPGAADRPASLGFAAMVNPPGRPVSLHGDAYGAAYVRFEGLGWRYYALGLCGSVARPLDFGGGVTLGGADDMPGWRLAALSEADRRMPDLRPGVTDLYRLWRPVDGGGKSILQRAYREAGQAAPRLEELARFDRPIGAMTTFYGEGKVLIYVTLETQEAGVLDLYLFTLDA